MERVRMCLISVAALALVVGGRGATPSRAAEGAAQDKADGGVLCGIDVLVRDGFKQLEGRRVGLITNHTGLNRNGVSTIELLNGAPQVELTALYSPEHGLKGVLDEKVKDSTDPLTGLKVFSLYGKTRRPTAAMLEGIDTLVFDIQDIGTRFYTYIATMGLAMEAAADAGLRFVVLDRPNPINGERVFGPFNDQEGQFTAYHRIPLVHGMTIGELAKMFQAERSIKVDLLVIPMEGWRRSMWLDETELTWLDPSPNMRSLTQATLYPAIGMIEACNVSVGRGTDTPFERFGAPWIKERPLAARLNGLGLAGVRFLPYRFRPKASKYKEEECGGVQIVLTDRNAFDPADTGLAIVRALHVMFGDAFEVAKVNRLLFNQDLLDRVTRSTEGTRFTHLWQDELQEFMVRRAKFMLYN